MGVLLVGLLSSRRVTEPEPPGEPTGPLLLEDGTPLLLEDGTQLLLEG